MSYQVFARKYRPQCLAELVGQQVVAQTLASAVEQNRVAHAFLFTGVRGVGKTTTARILAKSLNCETRGPTPNPCQQCSSCLGIAASTDIDVLEIDGASNNSVEDIRRLQETLPFRPARARFKVVIVDEVHMLSGAAFNAFLKTLEEPPPHVKFVLATTESHKVPVTIRSRCQRYDFRLVPQDELVKHLEAVLNAEGIKADAGSIRIVAREAGGSVRDALTLLDQLVAQGGEGLDEHAVTESLGLVERTELGRCVGALLQGQSAPLAVAVDALWRRGADLVHFLQQAQVWVRDLTMLQATGNEALLEDLSRDEADGLIAQAGDAAGRAELGRLFGGMAKLLEEVSRSASPRYALEVGLMRLAERPALVSVQDLIARIDAIEGQGVFGASGGGALGGGSLGAGAVTDPAGPQQAQLRQASKSAAPALRAVARVGSSEQDRQPDSLQEVAPNADVQAAVQPMPAAAVPPSTVGQVSAAVAMSATSAKTSADASAQATPTGAPAAAPVGTDEMPASRRTPASGEAKLRAPLTPAPVTGLSESWAQVLASLGREAPSIAAVLDHATPLELSDRCLHLAFPAGSFFARQADNDHTRQALQRACLAYLGDEPELRFSCLDDSDATAPTQAQHRMELRDQQRRAIALEAEAQPVVRALCEVFPEAAKSLRVEVCEDRSWRSP